MIDGRTLQPACGAGRRPTQEDLQALLGAGAPPSPKRLWRVGDRALADAVGAGCRIQCEQWTENWRP
jgi:hypothetical protein